MEAFSKIVGYDLRTLVQQVINFGLIVASALIIWKSLMLVTNTESPIVVVLTGSMEPGYYRGDLLFLWWDDSPIVSGDVIVYIIDGKEIPIVHRAMNVHQDTKTNEEKVLSKGDNNPVNDRGLYNRGQLWLDRYHLLGRIKGYVPYIGVITILMNDYPLLKYAMIGSLFIFVLATREKQ
eukprot:TRINITY_DN15083_c0_g1_i1.p1 TRINITY_DN15083_c0_g1~~TRINITY_DN15083_c0_g1_i1.p1  ORF type:complete len:193 (-),score=49.79 TRINITY_DN15083_c0_g1_i1:92-628(-)